MPKHWCASKNATVSACVAALVSTNQCTRRAGDAHTVPARAHASCCTRTIRSACSWNSDLPDGSPRSVFVAGAVRTHGRRRVKKMVRKMLRTDHTFPWGGHSRGASPVRPRAGGLQRDPWPPRPDRVHATWSQNPSPVGTARVKKEEREMWLCWQTERSQIVPENGAMSAAPQCATPPRTSAFSRSRVAGSTPARSLSMSCRFEGQSVSHTRKHTTATTKQERTLQGANKG